MCQQPWLKDVDWSAYQKKTVKAPWLPDCKDPLDTSNFAPYEHEQFSSNKKYVDTGWDKDF